MDLAIGPDGSFAVIDGPVLLPRGRWYVNLYSATGEPLRAIQSPSSWLSRVAYNGHLIAAIGRSGPVFLYDTSGNALLRCNMDKYLSEGMDRFLFLSPDGKELRILDGYTQTLHRFTLPKLE